MWREENRRTRRKTLEARRESKLKTKLKPHMAPGRNRARDTLVGGERSHHCAISAPQFFFLFFDNKSRKVLRYHLVQFPSLATRNILSDWFIGQVRYSIDFRKAKIKAGYHSAQSQRKQTQNNAVATRFAGKRARMTVRESRLALVSN